MENRLNPADWTEDEAVKIGQAVAQLLYLRKDKEQRYKTEYGTKTARGLALTVARVINDTIDSAR